MYLIMNYDRLLLRLVVILFLYGVVSVSQRAIFPFQSVQMQEKPSGVKSNDLQPVQPGVENTDETTVAEAMYHTFSCLSLNSFNELKQTFG